MNPDILDKILRAIIVFLQVEKLGCTNSSWKRVMKHRCADRHNFLLAEGLMRFSWQHDPDRALKVTFVAPADSLNPTEAPYVTSCKHRYCAHLERYRPTLVKHALWPTMDSFLRTVWHLGQPHPPERIHQS